MSTAEGVLRNLGALEAKVNSLDGERLDQAVGAALTLQIHATLALAGAVVLVAEEMASLRAALTEQ